MGIGVERWKAEAARAVGIRALRSRVGPDAVTTRLRVGGGSADPKRHFGVMTQRSPHGAGWRVAAICKGVDLDRLMRGWPLVARGLRERA